MNIVEELDELIDSVGKMYSKEQDDTVKLIIGQFLVNLQVYRDKPLFYIEGNWLHIHFPHPDKIEITDFKTIVYSDNGTPTIKFRETTHDELVFKAEIENIKRYIKNDQAIQDR